MYTASPARRSPRLVVAAALAAMVLLPVATATPGATNRDVGASASAPTAAARGCPPQASKITCGKSRASRQFLQTHV